MLIHNEYEPRADITDTLSSRFLILHKIDAPKSIDNPPLESA